MDITQGKIVDVDGIMQEIRELEAWLPDYEAKQLALRDKRN
jgi:hypothetical protein